MRYQLCLSFDGTPDGDIADRLAASLVVNEARHYFHDVEAELTDTLTPCEQENEYAR